MTDLAIPVRRSVRSVVNQLVEALEASIHAGDSHYAHHDPMGTAGANCPACRARAEANELAHDAIAAARELDQ